MRAALLIARKDLRERMRDKSAFLFGIVAPLGLAVIFSFIFTPIQNAVFHAEYVVVDLDGGRSPMPLATRSAGSRTRG